MFRKMSVRVKKTHAFVQNNKMEERNGKDFLLFDDGIVFASWSK
jgi:hypothetical protein